MRKLFPICAAGLLMVSTFCSARAFGQDKWMPLGEARTSAVTSSTYIPSDTAKGTLCAIRFKSEGGLLEVDHVTVHFGNSQTLQVAAKLNVNPDSYSPTVALPGIRRTVKGVDIVYKLLGKTPPTVDLWGNALAGALVCPQ